MFAIKVQLGGENKEVPIVVIDLDKGLTFRVNYVKLSGTVEVKSAAREGRTPKKIGSKVWIEAEHVEFEEILDNV